MTFPLIILKSTSHCIIRLLKAYWQHGFIILHHRKKLSSYPFLPLSISLQGSITDYVMNFSKLTIQQMIKAIDLHGKEHLFSSWACKDDKFNLLKTFFFLIFYFHWHFKVLNNIKVYCWVKPISINKAQETV